MNRKPFIALMFFILIISIMMFGIGCAEDAVFPGNEAEKQPERITSNIVSIPIERVRTLNPLLSLDEDTYFLNKLILEGLFTLNDNLEAVGVLADSYEYEADGRSMQVRLKEGITWQDGTAFTAEDVKFTIDAYKSVSSAQQGSYGPFIELIRSAKVIDPLTVQIQFTDAENATVENLVFPILPSHKYSRPSDLARDTSNYIPMGTGPYIISDMEEGKQITLSGNLNYRGTVPKNILLFKFMPNKEEAVNLFDVGEINLAFLRAINRNTLVEDKVVKMVSFPSNEVEVLGFNFSHGALQNRGLRQAIAHAVDNQMILETCYYNNGILNQTIFYPGYRGIESEGALYGYDLDKAASLLKASGYEGLSLSLVFNAENHARNLAAQIIKSGLEKVGISVTLVPLENEDYYTALTRGDFDLYLGGFRFSENYDLRPVLQSDGEYNYTRYSDARMDGLLDELQRGISAEQKRKTFQSIHELYVKEIPYYCILYKTYGIAASVDLTGEIEPYFYHIYHGSEDWRVTYVKPEE